MRSSWSVIPDMAETTTIGKVSPGSVLCRAIICATRRMRSPLPTEVPPNLRTLLLMGLLLLRLLNYPRSIDGPWPARGGPSIHRGPTTMIWSGKPTHSYHGSGRACPCHVPYICGGANAPPQYFLYNYIYRFACREGRSPQCLVQVIDQILYRLQAYRQANEVGCDTGLELLVGRQL